ncbi:EGF-like module-containing mucin-like hormone receptor-like 1-like [Platysternon megacephalum]|uniref:EGF-like module-containing mucin-like hormone receptor-like 1-like n=1 Tax=Platysternon megacephalum TaxID=55544 RepID=A0A4D9DQE3_9SAUR|nr:EGF-like module-containing mucin-like hormone receptor-like 1-like [Platysternon megacephalum]
MLQAALHAGTRRLHELHQRVPGADPWDGPQPQGAHTQGADPLWVAGEQRAKRVGRVMGGEGTSLYQAVAAGGATCEGETPQPTWPPCKERGSTGQAPQASDGSGGQLAWGGQGRVGGRSSGRKELLKRSRWGNRKEILNSKKPQTRGK